MMNLFKNKKAFTLIEVMISMAIFASFVAIVINSYTSIVQGQRDTNDYRVLYAESRQVISKISEELKAGTVFYDNYADKESFNGAVDNLILISQNGQRVVKIKYFDGKVRFSEQLNCSAEVNSFDLNSPDVEVEELHFYVSPAENPFDNVLQDVYQFQPKVTVYLKVGGIDFQTTISSRAYNAAPEIELNCIPND